MNFKKSALFAFLFTACSLPVGAQDTVKLIINGEIRPITCSLSTPASGSTQTLTMQPQDISRFTGIGTEVDGQVSANNTLTFSCPQTGIIRLTVQDNLVSTTARKYLLDRYWNNNNNTTNAKGVGVTLHFYQGSTRITALDQNFGTARILSNQVNTTGYSTKENRTFTIKPHYYQHQANVTPGLIYAEAMLTFAYQ